MKWSWSRNPLVYSLVVASLAWNLFILAAVIANTHFALSRAAGGQYSSFPTGIRIAYALSFLLVAYQSVIFFALYQGKLVRPSWLPKLFFAITVLSVLANAASRSSNERLNVIPAVIIALAFWKYGVKGNKEEKAKL